MPDMKKAFKDYAAILSKDIDFLTTAEKQQAWMNAVLNVYDIEDDTA